jgi:hypothetical protein
MTTRRSIERLSSQVRIASRRWKPGQIWEARPALGTGTHEGGRPRPNAAYVNGLCARHGGRLVMATLKDRRGKP